MSPAVNDDGKYIEKSKRSLRTEQAESAHSDYNS